MALYTGHRPKIKKVTNGLVFSDDFTRSDGPVGNQWSKVGSDDVLIDTNSLKIDASTAGEASGVTKNIYTRPVFRDTCEIFVRIETISKYSLTDAKSSIVIYKDNGSFLVIEIKTGNSSVSWDNDKIVTIYSMEDGVPHVLTSATRVIDTTTSDNLFKIKVDKTTVEVNYLDGSDFVTSNTIYATHNKSVLTRESKVGLFASDSEIDYKSIEIRAHEKVYIYGVPDAWYVDVGRTRNKPVLGVITLDTSLMDINVDDRFDFVLVSKATSPAASSTIEYTLEAIGGDSFGMFNKTALTNPIGGVRAGVVNSASPKVIKPIIFLNAESAASTVLGYSGPYDKIAVPVRTNKAGTITAKLMDVATGSESLFSSFSIAPDIDKYITIRASDLPPNRETSLKTYFEVS